MRTFPIGRQILCAVALASSSLCYASDDGGVKPQPPQAPPASRTETQIELQIELVAPLSHYSGPAYVAAADPRFVLAGKIVWVQRPEVMALHSRHAFAIHSPAKLGIQGNSRGTRICLLLIRSIKNEVQHWELSALKPDAGCRGGG